jgi:hypothetical protein
MAAPRYIPGSPPRPNRLPSTQSGAATPPSGSGSNEYTSTPTTEVAKVPASAAPATSGTGRPRTATQNGAMIAPPPMMPTTKTGASNAGMENP